MKTNLLVLLAFLLAVALSIGAAFLVPVRLHAQETRFAPSDALLAARACVHESTWAGGSSTNDCGGIIQVAENSRRDGETFAQALRRRMPHFAAGTTDRRWVHGLPAGPLARDPQGWPFRVPAHHFDEAWHAVYSRVVGYMRGREPLPCSPEPTRWFGRQTDGRHLAAALDSGLWREADCGPSANAFLYGIDPD